MLREAGLEGFLDGAPEAFVTRFQQTTPPVMAKGVEDTAFYRYVRLLALNDVGGDPSRFGIGVDDFHRANARARGARAAQPARLLDARHEALGRRAGAPGRAGRHGGRSGPPRCGAGGRRARRCAPAARPTRSRSTRSSRRSRARGRSSPTGCVAYMEKAMRERKVTTNWIEPDEAHEAAVLDYCRALYEHRPFLDDFEPVAGGDRPRRASRPRCARPR